VAGDPNSGRVHLGSSSLSLARASPASSPRPSQAGAFVPLLSVQSDVVRCKVWLRRYAEISSCIGAPVRQHVQTFRFIFSFFSRCHIHRLPLDHRRKTTAGIEEWWVNMWMFVDHHLPAGTQEWPRSLYHVLRSNLPLPEEKTFAHSAKGKEKLLDDHRSIWRLISRNAARG
jgi:hypothetical protein